MQKNILAKLNTICKKKKKKNSPENRRRRKLPQNNEGHI